MVEKFMTTLEKIQHQWNKDKDEFFGNNTAMKEKISSPNTPTEEDIIKRLLQDILNTVRSLDAYVRKNMLTPYHNIYESEKKYDKQKIKELERIIEESNKPLLIEGKVEPK